MVYILKTSCSKITSEQIRPRFPKFKAIFHSIGLRENSPENHIFHGKNHGFIIDFPWFPPIQCVFAGKDSMHPAPNRAESELRSHCLEIQPRGVKQQVNIDDLWEIYGKSMENMDTMGYRLVFCCMAIENGHL